MYRYTNFLPKGWSIQSKALGALLLFQATNFKEAPFESFYEEPCLKYFIDVLTKSLLATNAILLITRLNHFIPDSMKSDYRVIAENIINDNAYEL